ncbi:hypothetical protein NL676_003999 [Syzygium grande]|nr:hypothetical protein NL676_003999 [Syzygium grande]
MENRAMKEQHKETSSSSKKRRIARVPPKRGQIKVRIYKSLVRKVKELASMGSAKQSRGRGCFCSCSSKLASVTSLEDARIIISNHLTLAYLIICLTQISAQERCFSNRRRPSGTPRAEIQVQSTK